MDRLDIFHPVIADWFNGRFDAPSAPQMDAWPLIKQGRDVLIAAPTGSGKTLAAFLGAIDDLLRIGLEGQLRDQTYVLYISPLKALGNDIGQNLQGPLMEIRDGLLIHGLHDVNIRIGVRSGDTPVKDRESMRRNPPHILVTTPESFYLLLTSDSGRRMLRTIKTVIVDEIHAMVGNKRGSHLALSLERLAQLTPHSFNRIGLSATQKPIETVARFLVGQRERAPCDVIDSGHVRDRDLELELCDTPLEGVMSNEGWGEIYDRLVELINSHRTTLIFVNTRRWAERLAHHLSERLGEEHITSHHGSLSREHRLNAEQRLKAGQLKALVATASLELGIDIGDVDLVCQLGSPRSIAAFLQRVGRSGHAIDGTPKGRLFPLSRDELVECTALLHAVKRGELDRLIMPEKPLDVLAQQIIAEVANGEWEEEALYALVKRAYPYRELAWEEFQTVLHMVIEGYSTRRGRLRAYVHHDGVNQKLRARKGARLTALTSGGTIPDNGDYDVILDPEGIRIGTVNEDFAIESLAGDIFQLGNSSYRVLRIETTAMRVQDAKGLPPSIPFWFGEAPGRTDELSRAISHLKNELIVFFESGRVQDARSFCMNEVGLNKSAAEQLTDYLAAGYATFNALPTHDTIVMERFFDEAGDMHLVIHSPYGSRMNRAWGLALRKRFCRKFNFELQAAATEDTIILSLGATHSFQVIEASRYLNAKTVRTILIQALLDAPMFAIRWRWNASTALAVLRFRGGKRIPPQLQRMDAEDLVSVIFPDQLACLENIAGDREVPDHPLVQQTIADCLHEAMDIESLERMLEKLDTGEIKVVAKDLVEPSMLAREILTAQPYSFLDDAPAEERRTRAVMARRWVDPQSAAEIAQLDPLAIEKVKDEAWPATGTPDELHDALMLLAYLSQSELATMSLGFELMSRLTNENRVTLIQSKALAEPLWIAIERLSLWKSIHDDLRLQPMIEPPTRYQLSYTREEGLVSIVRSRLTGLGPVTVSRLADEMGVNATDIQAAMLDLEGEGFAMRGAFLLNVNEEQWCERRLLSRIHQYTLGRLRKEIEPVTAQVYMRFLFEWQGLGEQYRRRGDAALLHVLEMLEGYEAPAFAWESALLAARLENYRPEDLDQLCFSGRSMWLRRSAPVGDGASSVLKQSPITLLPRRNLALWRDAADSEPPAGLSSPARKVYAQLQEKGASFFYDLVGTCGLLETQLEETLKELAASGLVSSDAFSGVRAMMSAKNNSRKARLRRRSYSFVSASLEDAGRWTPLSPCSSIKEWSERRVEHVARVLLKRYGVVFRRVLDRESNLPPWRDLLLCYRRLEARGEIRGGRFVHGFSGEQFALNEAVGALRRKRNEKTTQETIVTSACDPLCLHGLILPGQRVPSLYGNRVLFQDGKAMAAKIGSKVQMLVSVNSDEERAFRMLLLNKNRLVREPVMN